MWNSSANIPAARVAVFRKSLIFSIATRAATDRTLDGESSPKNSSRKSKTPFCRAIGA
jgi:hypothetical protein